MKKELEIRPKRIVVYEAKTDPDWLMESSFPPDFKIVKVIGDVRKKIVRGNAADIPVD